jgi:HNH endonuclease
MVHDTAGNVLNVGRRTRKPSAALRRAVRERDGCRCRFPGCESRRTDAHHIRYWSNGGETKLGNLISLCQAHHRIVHDKGLVIAATSDGFAFYTAGGTPIPSSPGLAPPVGDITACHTAQVTQATIIPPYSGERLDLNLAIWVAFANARARAERRQATQTQAA